MFDTHCHLNFKAFAGRIEEIIQSANQVGIRTIVVPGTDVRSSKKAVELAEKQENIYAAVGIHPHHVFEIHRLSHLSADLLEIEKLLTHSRVVAIGEVGMDRHYYNKTKYPDYQIDEQFIELQARFLADQIKLAIKYNKSIIFHNREAKKDFLKVINDQWSRKLENKVVFHCCEPDQELLDYAVKQQIFIGVDGDITYRKDKQEFIRKVPLSRLVLETDSPFLLPRLRASFAEVATKAEQGYGGQAEPLHFPNEPKNLKLIAEFIADILEIDRQELKNRTEENSKILFQLT